MLEELGLGEADTPDDGRRRRLQHVHDPREARPAARRAPRTGEGAQAARPRHASSPSAAATPRRSASGSSSSIRTSTSRSGPGRSRTSASGSARAASASRAAASASRRSATSPPSLPQHNERRFQAWVQVSMGCNSTCSYCIVPAVRGRELSRRPGEILAEIEAACARRRRARSRCSARTSTPTAATCHPTRASASPSSCARWTRSTGSSAIRFTSPHPKDFRPDVIAAMAECAAVCEHAHLPLQSGSLADPQGDAPHLHGRALPPPRRPTCAPRSPTSRSEPTSSSASRARPRPTSRRRSRSSRPSATTPPSRSSTRPATAPTRRRCPTRCRRTSSATGSSGSSTSSSASRASATPRASAASRRCSSRAARAPTTRSSAGRTRRNTTVNFTGDAEPGDARPGADRGGELDDAPRHGRGRRPRLAMPRRPRRRDLRADRERQERRRRGAARSASRRGRLRGRDAGLPRASRSSRTSRRRALVAIWPLAPRGLGRRVRARSRTRRSTPPSRPAARRRSSAARGSTSARRSPSSTLPPAPTPELRARDRGRVRRARRRRQPTRSSPSATRAPPRASMRTTAGGVVRALELAELGHSLAPADDRLWDAGTRHADASSSALDVAAGRARAPDRGAHARDVRRRRRGRGRRGLAGPLSTTAAKILGLREVAELPREEAIAAIVAAHAPLRRVPAQVDAADPGPRRARRHAPARGARGGDRRAAARRTRRIGRCASRSGTGSATTTSSLEPRRAPVPLTPERVRLLCDYHAGVGVGRHPRGPARRRRPRPSSRIWNPDGSTAELSGNGTRIAARWLARRAGVDGGSPARRRTRGARGRCSTRRASAWTWAPSRSARPSGSTSAGRASSSRRSRVGNPHAVIRREPDRADLLRLGPLVERHPRFPNRTNVQLVAVDGPHALRVGVWERGAGETRSSGTSSVAAAAAAVANGWCDESRHRDARGRRPRGRARGRPRHPHRRGAGDLHRRALARARPALSVDRRAARRIGASLISLLRPLSPRSEGWCCSGS